MSFKLDGTRFKAFADDGTPLVGGKLHTYVSGTTTNKATYTDYTLGVANANPITLDARGEADVWLGTGPYTFVLKTSSLVTVDTVDGVEAPEPYGSADALRADLASTSAAAKGVGLSGFNPSLNYVARTQGWVDQRYGITPSMCQHAGTVDPTGVADSTAALQYWAACPWPKLGDPGATYKVSAQLTFAAGAMNIDGRGMTIVGGLGSYPGYGVLYVEGALTAIPDLSADVAKGDRSLSLVGPHGLTAGRVGVIFNPADYSWNNSYTYSRAGEFFRVNTVISTTDFKADNVLWAGYAAAAVDLYAMTENRVTIENLSVIAPGTGAVRPIRIRLATQVTARNVNCSGGDLVNFDLDRCCNFDLTGLSIDNRRQVAAATYGISIGNSQDGIVSGGQINATRHAVAMGGDDVVGGVVVRNVRVNGGATLRSDSALSNVPCADIHANCEAITYEDCTIFGGGSFNGKDVAYRNVTFKECAPSVRSVIQGGSMWVGGYAIAEGCTFEASGLYADGLVRLYIDPLNTLLESHLILRDNLVSLGATDVYARVDNSHATVKANCSVDGVDFLDCASLSNILRMTGTGTGNYARVMGVANGKPGASLYVEAGGYVVSNVRLMDQCGKATITSVPAAATAGASVTFPLSYGSRNPIMSLAVDAMQVNGKSIVSGVSSVSSTGVGLNIRTADSTTFGGVATDVSAHWTARF